MPIFPILETERTTIRPVEEGDYAFFYELLNSETWLKNIGNRNIATFGDAKKYIQKNLADTKSNCSLFQDKNTGEPLGVLSFVYRTTQEFPDIGYAMLPQFEGKGYAFEAVKRYFDYIVAQKLTPKMTAITLPENTKSIRILERLGLKLERTFEEDGEILRLYSLKMR